jgi:hypothetical protein
MTTHQELFSTYSDMYKDLHGFRPRFDTSSWSEEHFQKEFVEMSAAITVQMDEERTVQEANERAFEVRVAETIALGARDRETALKWIHEAEGSNGDNDYLCFLLNLRYGYL